MRWGRVLGFLGVALLLLSSGPVFARDVSFVEPGTTVGSATPDEAFKIEPKSEVDIGDSIINIVRRQSLFFVNQTSAPIKVEKVSISSDSTVSPQIVNDDCSKQTVLPPLSRCSIELTITPTGPGSWGIELLMTHNGTGRITRAKIIGKTAGSDASDKRDRGLFLSTKDVKPVDFGEVEVGAGKIVRSALMINDSPSPITLYSIDVIEADRSLQRLEQGCAADMDLRPGESCPVTLVWTPTGSGLISTDLIIRHSGQLGFAVVPVRGNAKGGDGMAKGGGKGSDKYDSGKGDGGSKAASSQTAPTPPTPTEVAQEVAKAAGAGVTSSTLSSPATGYTHLIGTVGNRAVILKPDGSTMIAQTGDFVETGGGGKAKIEKIEARSITLVTKNKRQELPLEAVQELKDKAASQRDAEKDKEKEFSGIGGSGSGLGR